MARIQSQWWHQGGCLPRVESQPWPDPGYGAITGPEQEWDKDLVSLGEELPLPHAAAVPPSAQGRRL